MKYVRAAMITHLLLGGRRRENTAQIRYNSFASYARRLRRDCCYNEAITGLANPQFSITGGTSCPRTPCRRSGDQASWKSCHHKKAKKGTSIAENNEKDGITNFLKTAKFGKHCPADGSGAIPTRNSMDSGVQCIIV